MYGGQTFFGAGPVGSDSPTMVLRSGQRRSIEPGSVIINATGYVGRENLPYEPLLSATGNVVSIQPTSAIHFLSSQAAYFLTHLLLMGKLDSIPRIEPPQAADRRMRRLASPG